MINYCEFIDMGYKGNRFTWLNKRFKKSNALIFKRLDRFLAKSDWLIKYPNTHVQNLPHTQSDQWPLLLHIYKDNSSTKHCIGLKPCGCSIRTFQMLFNMHGPIVVRCRIQFQTLSKLPLSGQIRPLEFFF